ncbi:unnamed protein product [Effrenium voratum]|nr:unnamed protein product [Effrenium voratum]
MGEGKSKVILPLLCASVADGSQLVRVVLLRSLLDSSIDHLRNVLGGMLGRRVYVLHFDRTNIITEESVHALMSQLRECRRTGSVLLMAEESTRSLQLKLRECCLKGESAKLCAEFAGVFSKGLHSVVDFFDEVDESLRLQNEQIYTLGSRQELDGGLMRWKVPFAIFRLLKMAKMQQLLQHLSSSHAIEMASALPCGKELTGAEFPRLRFVELPRNSESWKEMAFHLCQGLLGSHETQSEEHEKLGGLRDLSLQARDKLSKLVLDPDLTEEQCSEILASIREYDANPSLPCAALTARGLFAGDILRSALHKRRRVEFGVDNITWRSGMAVPFRFKDAPSERTEFSHPDLAITLTLRAYLEDGLTRESFQRVLGWLKDLPLREQGRRYRRWLLMAAASRDDCATETLDKAVARRLELPRKAEGLDLDDGGMVDSLWSKLAKNMQVIQDFLEEFVFPEETRQFPFKVSANAWDLAAGRLRGFSGTADNRQLLPLGVRQYEDKMLRHTDGHALRSRCDPEMGGPSPVKTLQAKEPQEILKQILAVSDTAPAVSVLIDCGALLTGMSNREVAQAAVALCPRFRAAIYFDKQNQIMVLDQSGKDIPLARSPLQPAHECFTYLDDKHTRGTDFRFAPAAIGAVTICRKTTKDRLVQACMRMRSLGLGQRVMLFLDVEVRRQLGSEAGACEPSVGLILASVTARSAEELRLAVVNWALQGAAFATRMPFLQEVSKSVSDVRRLAKLCREPEDMMLSAYCQSLASNPGVEEIPRRAYQTPKQILMSTDFSEQEAHRWGEDAESVIQTQLAYLKRTQLLSSEDVLVSCMDEEQEREREQEKEKEKEVEREVEADVCLPAVQPHRAVTEQPWQWDQALCPGFLARCKHKSDGHPNLHGISAGELESCGLPLPQLQDLRDMPTCLFVTSNWLHSVVVEDNCSAQDKAHALRNVDMFLVLHEIEIETIILLSGYEASHILREMRRQEHLSPWHRATRSELSIHLGHLNDAGDMALSPRARPRLPHSKHRAVLKLFNGSCGYSQSERAEVAKFLGILEPSVLNATAQLCPENDCHHVWSERQGRRVWDGLRDLRVLSRNGFVNDVPALEDSKWKQAVAAAMERESDKEQSGLNHFELHKCLLQVVSRRKNPVAVVPDFVKCRLHGHLFQGSGLERLLGL